LVKASRARFSSVGAPSTTRMEKGGAEGAISSDGTEALGMAIPVVARQRHPLVKKYPRNAGPSTIIGLATKHFPNRRIPNKRAASPIEEAALS
jgi:hypothetical protein